MSIGEEEWAAWLVWTIIKWTGIAVVFVIAIVVGWLMVLVALPAHAEGALQSGNRLNRRSAIYGQSRQPPAHNNTSCFRCCRSAQPP
jgi:hypothetical protein